jgi:hypothetical protein
MNTLQEIKHNLLGILSLGTYISAGIFCFFGIVLVLYVRSARRDRSSTETPVHFSWKFLFFDNAKKIIILLLCMFLIFRFCSSFLHTELSMEVALGVGFFLPIGLVPFIEFLMARSETLCNMLSMPREQYMNKMIAKASVEVQNVQSPTAEPNPAAGGDQP